MIGLHLSGALQNPAATRDQRKLAIQVNTALNNVDHWLAQAHNDTMTLIHLSNDQLAQPSTLTVLNDLATLSQYAYAGHIDQGTGQLQGGVIWIYANIQRLADFSVTRYIPS